MEIIGVFIFLAALVAILLAFNSWLDDKNTIEPIHNNFIYERLLEGGTVDWELFDKKVYLAIRARLITYGRCSLSELAYDLGVQLGSLVLTNARKRLSNVYAIKEFENKSEICFGINSDYSAK